MIVKPLKMYKQEAERLKFDLGELDNSDEVKAHGMCNFFFNCVFINLKSKAK